MLSLAPMLTHQRIDLLRDEYGIPHIYAQTLEGAAFASGYAQAEDRPLKLIAAAQGNGLTPFRLLDSRPFRVQRSPRARLQETPTERDVVVS